MDRGYAHLVNRACQHLYERLADPPTLEEVARRTGVSKFHFNRVFQQQTGLHFGAYARRLRLDTAYRLLGEARSPRSVTDVALATGFASPAAFSRAFKRRHGMTPRARQTSRPAPPPAPGAVARRGSGSAFEIVDREPVTLYGLFGRGFRHCEFSALAAELARELGARTGLAAAQGAVGVSFQNPWAEGHARSTFFLGLRRVPRTRAQRLERLVLAGGPHARAVHCGPYAFLCQSVSRLHATWPAPFGLSFRDHTVVQNYLVRPVPGSAGSGETELLLPLRRQGSQHG